MPAQRMERGQTCVCLDGLLREAAGCSLNDSVELMPVEAPTAEHVTLRPRKIRPIERDLDYIASLIDVIPVMPGSSLRATLFGSESIDFDVVKTTPSGPVIIGPATALTIEECSSESPGRTPSYEDVGGAKAQLQRIREMIELPLRFSRSIRTPGRNRSARRTALWVLRDVARR